MSLTVLTRFNWAKAYFVATIALLVFAGGFFSCYFKLFPYRWVVAQVNTYKHYKEQAKNEFPGLNPARYEGTGVVIYPIRKYMSRKSKTK